MVREKDIGKYLKANYKSKTKQELAEDVGMTYNQVDWELRKLGLRRFRSRPWTEEDYKILYEKYPKIGNKETAKVLGRSIGATNKKAKSLGIEIDWSYEYRDSQGYVICCKDRNNKQYKHRQVMEEHLGRELGPEEIVHHINENKGDNSIENLEITTRSEHMKHHLHNEEE